MWPVVSREGRQLSRHSEHQRRGRRAPIPSGHWEADDEAQIHGQSLARGSCPSPIYALLMTSPETGAVTQREMIRSPCRR